MFSHFTPETVALLTSIQDSALEEWIAACRVPGAQSYRGSGGRS